MVLCNYTSILSGRCALFINYRKHWRGQQSTNESQTNLFLLIVIQLRDGHTCAAGKKWFSKEPTSLNFIEQGRRERQRHTIRGYLSIHASTTSVLDCLFRYEHEHQKEKCESRTRKSVREMWSEDFFFFFSSCLSYSIKREGRRNQCQYYLCLCICKLVEIEQTVWEHDDHAWVALLFCTKVFSTTAKSLFEAIFSCWSVASTINSNSPFFASHIWDFIALDRLGPFFRTKTERAWRFALVEAFVCGRSHFYWLSCSVEKHPSERVAFYLGLSMDVFLNAVTHFLFCSIVHSRISVAFRW
jgi:hypothetical protein